ncbi:hypothetical protein SAMN06298214_0071 [Bacteroidales bacterium WCE2004]|nr:hypothetical protein SAMN06298214_0071 [Bacteroidales bacterium WCE2004]
MDIEFQGTLPKGKLVSTIKPTPGSKKQDNDSKKGKDSSKKKKK